MSFSGELKSDSPASQNALSTVIQNYVTGKTSNITAIAGPNATSYPLLSNSIKGLELQVTMLPFEEQLIPSIVFKSLSFIPSTDKKEVKLSAALNITINSPLGAGSPINITSLNFSLSLIYENSTVGVLNISDTPLQKLDTATYDLQFNNTQLILSNTSQAYTKFSQSFIQVSLTSSIYFGLVGLCNVDGSFALGSLNISQININNNVSLVGLGGLNNISVHSISIDGENSNGLLITINVTITNLGVINLGLTNFTLDIADVTSGTIIGQIQVGEFLLQPGSNFIKFMGLVRENIFTLFYFYLELTF